MWPFGRKEPEKKTDKYLNIIQAHGGVDRMTLVGTVGYTTRNRRTKEVISNETIFFYVDTENNNRRYIGWSGHDQDARECDFLRNIAYQWIHAALMPEHSNISLRHRTVYANILADEIQAATDAGYGPDDEAKQKTT